MADSLNRISLWLSIMLFLGFAGCFDSKSVIRRENPGSWPVDDPVLTTKLYEIAKQTYPTISQMDTTQYRITLYRERLSRKHDFYVLFFTEKAILRQKIYGGGIGVRFRLDDLSPIDLLPAQ